MKLNVPKPTQRALETRLKALILDELDLEIGDLKAMVLAEECLSLLGPIIYNAAIHDAQAYLNERVTDMDSVLHFPENF